MTILNTSQLTRRFGTLTVVVFVEDAMAALTAEEHVHSITRIFPRMGRVRRTAEVLSAFKPSATQRK